MEDSKKVYLGNLKASEKFGDDILNGVINVTELQKQLEEWSFNPEKSEDTFIKIKVVKKKEPNQFKQTHHIELDQFQYTSVQEREAEEVTAS